MEDSQQPTKTTPTTTDLQPGQLQDREMEEALIGAVLINPGVFTDVTPVLSVEDFYLTRHQWIWEAFSTLFQRDKSFDLLMVRQELENSSRLDDVGGMEYLANLAGRVPSSLHAESYAHNINALAVRRRMVSAANNIAKLAYRKDYDVDTVIEESEKEVFGVSQDRYKRDLTPVSIFADRYLDRLSIVSKDPESVTGLTTGLKSVDKALGGLQKSDFVIVAGRPGMGKTGFLVGIAKHVGLSLMRNVAIFTLEMSAEQLLQRMLAQDTQIDSQRLRQAKFDDNEMYTVVHAISNISTSHIYIDDTPAITPMQMRAKCRRLQQEKTLDLVIVDYLQLMSGDTRSENRVQEVSYISRYLKVLARDLDVPVIAAAQLSRAVEQRQDKLPVLSDLRESGSLEQDADLVMFISRPEQMKEDSPNHNLAKLIIAKHRNGPVHSGIDLVFIDRLASFFDKAIES
ncbi:MAG TPA: replicative DNA helicase [Anaerolineaceae bacterium]|nr:replicative DNA helicase [Anaerolineaceae bacterium]